MQLSVIIVNYNVKYFLEQCLYSLQQAIKNIEAEIFVSDNCSSDGSVAYLQDKFPSINFIENQQNLGFAKANNLVLKQAIGKYILFLNPDTILQENVLEACIHFFETHPNAGAAGVRMLDGSGNFLPESKRSFPSPLVSFFKLAGLSALFPKSKIFGKYALGYLNENEDHEVDVLSGAYFFTKKTTLETCGSFDENFFMYGEDIDLSYRIQQNGFVNYYIGTQAIIHFKGESTKKNSLNYVRMFFKAMSLFVKKHYHGAGGFLMNIGLQIAIFLRAIISIIAAPFNALKYLFSKKNKKHKTVHVFCIGDEMETQIAQQIILKHSPETLFECCGNIDEINFNNKSVDEVIFCLGTLSYKEAFVALKKIPVSVDVKWFAKNSTAIAGSSHKDFRGEVYF